MREILHHGGRAEITVVDRDICLATERRIAASYLHGPGWVYTVELDGSARIADEDEARDAAAAVAGADPWVAALLGGGAWAFELIDERSVRDELARRGWHGVRFREANPDNEVEHETVRIWAAGIARVINREENRS